MAEVQCPGPGHPRHVLAFKVLARTSQDHNVKPARRAELLTRRLGIPALVGFGVWLEHRVQRAVDLLCFRGCPDICMVTKSD